MTTLFEDLLLLARLDSGRPLAREPVELVSLAAEAVQTAQAVGPSWPLHLEAERPLEVIGDRTGSGRSSPISWPMCARTRRPAPPRR